MSSTDFPSIDTSTASRTLRACDACRSKKIKCDGIRPLCDGCKYSKIPCTYLKPHRKQRSRLGGASRNVHQQYTPSTNSETTKTPIQNDLNRTPEESFVRPRGHPAFNLISLKEQISRQRFGNVDSYEGHSLSSPETKLWIWSHTGEEVDFSIFFPSVAPPHRCQKTVDPYRLALPTRRELQDMAQIYLASTSHKIFPVWSRDMLVQGIEQVYDSLDAHVCVSSGRALVFTMLSFFSTCDQRNPWLHESSEATFSEAALQLLPDILREGLSIGGFGAIASMCAYQSTFGKVEILEQYVSIATRMMFSLGGHLELSSSNEFPPTPGVQATPLIQAHVRKIFWGIYAIDKDLCFRTLRPPIINDDDCDMSFGPTPRITLSDSTFNDTTDNSAFHPADIRLSILKARIYRGLYSAKALRNSNADILKSVRELDQELDAWKSELPVTYQPERSEIREVPRIVRENIRLLLLHLEYYQALTMIHRASTRCSAWSEHAGEKAIQSSVDLCLEASRTTIHYLEASRHFPRAESFWFSSHYPIPSLVMIFCYMLQHPTHPRAREDYGLLSIAPAAVAQVKSQGLSADETEHVNLVHFFFSELARLAKCAMDKSG